MRAPGRERDVEADEHVGEARRKDGLAEVLCPAVPDGRPGLVSLFPDAERRICVRAPMFRELERAQTGRVVEDAVSESIHRTT